MLITSKTRHSFILLLLLALAACGTTQHVNHQDYVTEKHTTLSDSIWALGNSQPEGFTLNINTWKMPNEGIAVAYYATQGCHDRTDLDFVVEHAKVHEGYIGGWLDTISGNYYFDSVRIFPEDSLKQAKYFGTENKQKAIYILSNGTEIRLEDKERR